MKAAKPFTVGALVEDAAKRFEDAGLAYGHGTATAFDDAAFLVLETLHQPPYALEKNWKRRPGDAERAAIERAVAARIATRKPTSYIVNRAWLQGIPFYVDERVIVPRSFIAEILYRSWADELPRYGGKGLFARLFRSGRTPARGGGFLPPGAPEEIATVLDLCTGSGCLAILAAHLFPGAQVDAVDLSRDALDVAERNVRESQTGGRVTLHHGDLFAPLQGKKYDLIITNPPYVDAQGMAGLPPEFRHEPEMALASGADGLDLLRRIIAEAPAYMSERSGMMCEIGRGKDNLEAAFPRLPFLWIDTAGSEGEVFWLTRKQFMK